VVESRPSQPPRTDDGGIRSTAAVSRSGRREPDHRVSRKEEVAPATTGTCCARGRLTNSKHAIIELRHGHHPHAGECRSLRTAVKATSWPRSLRSRLRVTPALRFPGLPLTGWWPEE